MRTENRQKPETIVADRVNFILWTKGNTLAQKSSLFSQHPFPSNISCSHFTSHQFSLRLQLILHHQETDCEQILVLLPNIHLCISAGHTVTWEDTLYTPPLNTQSGSSAPLNTVYSALPSGLRWCSPGINTPLQNTRATMCSVRNDQDSNFPHGQDFCQVISQTHTFFFISTAITLTETLITSDLNSEILSKNAFLWLLWLHGSQTLAHIRHTGIPLSGYSPLPKTDAHHSTSLD